MQTIVQKLLNSTGAFLMMASAVTAGDCRRLLDHGWWENTTTSVVVAAINGCDVNVRDGSSSSPLYIAANLASAAAVEALLSAGASVNSRNNIGETPLHRAAMPSAREWPKKLAALIGAGADIEARNSDGDTPLFLASRHPSAFESLEILIAAGANVVARNRNGLTPIVWAVMSGSTDSVVALLAAGASPHYQDLNGDTLLHLAAQRFAPEIISVLLDAGVDPSKLNNAFTGPKTALDIAEENPSIKGTAAYWQLYDAQF